MSDPTIRESAKPIMKVSVGLSFSKTELFIHFMRNKVRQNGPLTNELSSNLLPPRFQGHTLNLLTPLKVSDFMDSYLSTCIPADGS